MVALWALLVVLAARLPSGLLKDLAGFLPACVTLAAGCGPTRGPGSAMWEGQEVSDHPGAADHPEVPVAGDPPLGLGNQLGAGHGIRPARSEGQAELLLNPTGPPPCPALCGVIDRRSVRCHGDR